jgi:hypothetical protein
MKGVASETEPVVQGHPVFNPINSCLVAHVVLRHGRWTSTDFNELGFALDPQEIAQVGGGDLF